MTRREATLILIRHAVGDCIGAGCGPGHQVPSYKEAQLVAEAILKVWPEKHYGPNWFNLGLPNPTQTQQTNRADAKKCMLAKRWEV